MPLDAEHHDVVRAGPLEGFPFRTFVKGVRQRLTYVRRPVKRIYGCKVRLVATSPTTGKIMPTDQIERVTEIDNRWARPEALEAAARA